MLKTQRDALLSKMRNAIRSGKTIAVVGWMDQNHNTLTRSLSAKKVKFYGVKKMSPGSSCGLVLHTKYVNHALVERLTFKHDVYPHILEVSQIRGLLRSCKDILITEEPVAPGKVVKKVASVPAEQADDRVLDFITEPRRQEMTSFDKFAIAFCELAEVDGRGGRVSSFELTRLRKKYGIDTTPTKLVKTGWLAGEKERGKKRIGWYIATPQLIQHVHNLQSESDNPYERAMALISQKETLLQQKQKIDEQLERIAVAERVIEELKDLEL